MLAIHSVSWDCCFENFDTRFSTSDFLHHCLFVQSTGLLFVGLVGLHAWLILGGWGSISPGQSPFPPMYIYRPCISTVASLYHPALSIPLPSSITSISPGIILSPLQFIHLRLPRLILSLHRSFYHSHQKQPRCYSYQTPDRRRILTVLQSSYGAIIQDLSLSQKLRTPSALKQI